MDRETCKAMHREVDDAMQEIATKYGMVWESHRFTFSGTGVKSKMRFTEKDAADMSLKSLGLKIGEEKRGTDGKLYTVNGYSESKGRLVIEREGRQYTCRPGFFGIGKLTLGRRP